MADTGDNPKQGAHSFDLTALLPGLCPLLSPSPQRSPQGGGHRTSEQPDVSKEVGVRRCPLRRRARGRTPGHSPSCWNAGLKLTKGARRGPPCRGRKARGSPMSDVLWFGFQQIRICVHTPHTHAHTCAHVGMTGLEQCAEKCGQWPLPEVRGIDPHF